MQDKIAFKSVQGNLSLFRVRASQCPLHMRRKIQGPSNIPMAEISLLLRCLFKDGMPLELKPGNQLSSQGDLGYKSFCVAVVTSGSN